MIIAFSGRIKSGKSTLAKFLINQGYEKVSFADYLRELLCKLYNVPLSLLTTQEGKLSYVVWEWNLPTRRRLCNIIGIEENSFDNYEDKKFSTPREALQYIGTECLRKYDEDFHVKRTLNRLDLSKNYVIDDMRYKNELEGVKQLGGYCLFIIRPNNFEISNHSSETSLLWSDFDIHIINNTTERRFIKRFITFFKYITSKNQSKTRNAFISRKELQEELKKSNYDTTSLAQKYHCSRDKIVWWCANYCIPIERNIYNVNKHVFQIPTSESAYWAGVLSSDGCIKKSGKSKTCYILELSSDDLELVEGFKAFTNSEKEVYQKPKRKNGKISYSVVINSPYIIENLKYWNLKPKKSRFNEIPDIIKNNPEFLNHWFRGLIDGDGSICYTKKGLLTISCLASKEIILFLKNMYELFNPNIVENVKNIDNLWDIRFFGNNARQLAAILYPENSIALKRKWEKILNHA